MRKHIITWLKRALAFIEPPNPYKDRVKELVAQAETFQLANDTKIEGHRKRSWVLNNLITQFPSARVRDLALLIEQVIQEI